MKKKWAKKDIASIIFLVFVVIGIFAYFKVTAVKDISKITAIFDGLEDGMFELKYKDNGEVKTVFGTFTNNAGNLTFIGLDNEMNQISLTELDKTRLSYIIPKCMLGDRKPSVSMKRVVQGKAYYCLTNEDRTAYLTIAEDMFGYKANIQDDTDPIVKNTHCSFTMDNSRSKLVELEMKFIVGNPDTTTDEQDDFIVFITNNYW